MMAIWVQEAPPTRPFASIFTTAVGAASDAHIRSRVSELQAATAERVIEKTAINRAWVLTRLQETSFETKNMAP